MPTMNVRGAIERRQDRDALHPRLGIEALMERLMTWNFQAFPDFDALRTLKHLSTEVIELTEAVTRERWATWLGDRQDNPNWGDVWAEWAGIALMVLCLGDRLGIDVPAALSEQFRTLMTLDFQPGPDGIRRHSGKSGW